MLPTRKRPLIDSRKVRVEMPGFEARAFRIGLAMLGSGIALHAQPCLSLSHPRIFPNSPAVVEIYLHSPQGGSPATIQWKLQSVDSAAVTLTVEDGPALAASGKTAVCLNVPDGLTCLAVGRNNNAIANGIIARVTAVLSGGATLPSLEIRNPGASTPDGLYLPIAVSGDCTLNRPHRGKYAR